MFVQLENQSELCRRVLLLRRHLSLPEPEKSDEKSDKKWDKPGWDWRKLADTHLMAANEPAEFDLIS